MRLFLERNLPPGYTYKTETIAVLVALIAGVLNSILGFLSVFLREKQWLYIRVGMDLILDESRLMPDFVSILGGRILSLIVLAALILVVSSIIHYAHFYNGSKSIYLMRRLPNSSELHRRCLLIPALSALVFLLTALAALLINYAIYMNFTPQPCLMPGQWQKIWRVFR